MDRNPSPTAEQLRMQLLQANRDIRGLREKIQAMRILRDGLRARLGTARRADRRAADSAAPDWNRDVGGEG